MGSFREYLRQQEEEQAVIEVERAVEAALFPFHPGKVNVWIEDDYRAPGTKMFSIQSMRYPQLICKIQVDAYRLDFEIINIGRYLAKRAFNHFRAIPRITPEDNIVLGEE